MPKEPLTQETAEEADSVAAYIALVQAQAHPPVPATLVGPSLAEQLAQFTATYRAELGALFSPEAE